MNRMNLISVGCLICLACAACFTRFSSLGQCSFWCDELRYTYLAHEPCTRADYDRHGFAAYIRCYQTCLRIIGLTIEDEASFRALNAGLGVLAVVIMYFLGLIVGGQACAIVAALLLTFNPFAVDHARIATQHGSVIFGSTWMLLSLAGTVRSRRWIGWLSLVASSAFVWHMQVFTICYIVGTWSALALWQGVSMFRKGVVDRRFSIQYVCAGACLAVICMPEYFIFLRTSMQEGGRLNIGSGLRTALEQFCIRDAVSDILSVSTTVRWLYYLFIAAGILVLYTKNGYIYLTLVITSMVTYAIMRYIRISLLDNINTFPTRYVSFVLPAIIIVVAAAANEIYSFLAIVPDKPGTIVRRAVVASYVCVVAFICISHYIYWRYKLEVHPITEDKDIARVLLQCVKPGDRILCNLEIKMLERIMPGYSNSFDRVPGSFNGTGLSVDYMGKYLDTNKRVWSTSVNGFVRWSGHPVVEFMDKQCLLLPLGFPYTSVHLWSSPQCDEDIRREASGDSEKKMLNILMMACQNKHKASRRLAEVIMNEGDTNDALRVFRMNSRAYPYDPWYWAIGAGQGKNRVSALLRRLISIVLCEMTGQSRMSLLRQSDIDKICSSRRLWLTEKYYWMCISKNAHFDNGVSNWSSWGYCNNNNILEVRRDGEEGNFIRLSNEDGRLAGIKQHVNLVSGEIVRISATVRAVDTNEHNSMFGARLAVNVSEKEEEPQVIWMNQDRQWVSKSTIFTNRQDSSAVFYFHLGYGHVTTTADVTRIKVDCFVPSGISSISNIGDSTRKMTVNITDAGFENSETAVCAKVSNLIANGTFEVGQTGWYSWGNEERATDHISTAGVHGLSTAKTCVHVENPDAGLVGLKQNVGVVSGAVYKLSGVARSTNSNALNGLFGGRVALYLPPQQELQLIWMTEEQNKWSSRSLLFTNQVTGTATVLVHLGYGRVSSTGEFTDIRLERVSE